MALAAILGIRVPQKTQEVGTTWRKTTDPAGIVEYAFRDNLGRDLRLIRNYVWGGEPGSYWDSGRGITVQRNLTSTFRHDGAGRLVRAVAWEYDPGTQALTKQVTGYEYGVRTADSPGASEVDRDDLVRRVVYGEDAAGTETFTEQVVLGYNRQGEVTWRGESAYGPPASQSYRARHALEYDLLGRLEKDAVSTDPPPLSFPPSFGQF